ncbi:hypothetical protein AVEN_127782-1 [Araneus ventricosus]|uniref:Uncharacterized protein n=1 Tax=Araneus ventricosus TaxID=182803 RepID=A0A4Y2DNE4_ARAVE|nr:hypothetical protein AVEN_127782-1 [Araneus ventricosus]
MSPCLTPLRQRMDMGRPQRIFSGIEFPTWNPPAPNPRPPPDYHQATATNAKYRKRKYCNLQKIQPPDFDIRDSVDLETHMIFTTFSHFSTLQRLQFTAFSSLW